MKSVSNIVLLAALFISVQSNSHAYASDLPSNPYGPACMGPIEVTRMYLKAVDRGELVIFDIVIDSSMLIPQRVEYVYELGTASPQIITFKVYSTLRQPLTVPGKLGSDMPKIRAIGAVLNREGTIIGTEAHIVSE